MKAHIALVAFFCAGLCAHANDKNFGSWGGSGQPCAVVTIDDQVSYNPGHSLGIRFFSASAPPEDETNFDEVRRKLAGVFAEHLGKSKFLSVRQSDSGRQHTGLRLCSGWDLSGRAPR